MGTVFPYPQMGQPLQESSVSLGSTSPRISRLGPMRSCLLLQSKVTQSPSFKRQDVGCKPPAPLFKGNLLQQQCLLGCFPKHPWLTKGPLKGLIIGRHVQFPKHVNLRSECYFFFLTFELLCSRGTFYCHSHCSPHAA